MTPDLLDDLRRADPVPDEVTVPAALASRVLAIPDRRARRRRRVWPARRLVPATVLVLGIAAAVLMLGRGESPSLAARAYAATSGKGIAHWRIDIASYADGKLDSRRRIEGWALGNVTHTLQSDVHHGKAGVTVDTRLTPKRYSVWNTASHRVQTGTRKILRPDQEPIPSGDPLVAFRRAYRDGTLRDLGDGRFDLRLRHGRAGAVVYDVDPATGRPLRLTINSHQPAMSELHQPAMRGKSVLTFSVYERLPVTEANRRLLALLPHPGPGTKSATEVFAALRTGTAPDPAAVRRIGMAAARVREFKIDLAGARELDKDVWLLPGKGYVCLAGDSGSSCQALRNAERTGIDIDGPDGLLIAVPDGVKAVQARTGAGRPWRSYPIENGLVRLPDAGYEWRLVR